MLASWLHGTEVANGIAAARTAGARQKGAHMSTIHLHQAITATPEQLQIVHVHREGRE